MRQWAAKLMPCNKGGLEALLLQEQRVQSMWPKEREEDLQAFLVLVSEQQRNIATGTLNVAPAGIRDLTLAALGATRQRLELEAAYAAAVNMLTPKELSQAIAPATMAHAGQGSTRPLSSKASDLTESLPAIDETMVVDHGWNEKLEGVGFLQCHASSWVQAADGIIHLLSQHGVGRGQVIGVDAHENSGGHHQEACFSAHYSTSLPNLGTLNMRYMRVEEPVEDEYSWAALRSKATAKLGSKRAISITASRSAGSGAVLCCFYCSRDPRTQDLQEEVEVDGSSWSEAADKLVASLQDAELQMGQVLWIDAHCVPCRQHSLSLSAYFCRSLPSRGPLRVAYRCKAGCTWEELYAFVSDEILKLGLTKAQVLGITYCWEPVYGPVGFLFFEQPAQSETPAAAAAKPAKTLVWIQSSAIEVTPLVPEVPPTPAVPPHAAREPVPADAQLLGKDEFHMGPTQTTNSDPFLLGPTQTASSDQFDPPDDRQPLPPNYPRDRMSMEQTRDQRWMRQYGSIPERPVETADDKGLELAGEGVDPGELTSALIAVEHREMKQREGSVASDMDSAWDARSIWSGNSQGASRNMAAVGAPQAEASVHISESCTLSVERPYEKETPMCAPTPAAASMAAATSGLASSLASLLATPSWQTRQDSRPMSESMASVDGSEWSQGRLSAMREQIPRSQTARSATARSDGLSVTNTQQGRPPGTARLPRRDRELAGFEEMPGKDIRLDSLGHQMLASDLRACKRLCRFRGYGAFVVCNGRAFFKHQPAKQCLEFLVDHQGCTVYLDALGGIGTAAGQIAEGPSPAVKRRPHGPLRPHAASEVRVEHVSDSAPAEPVVHEDDLQPNCHVQCGPIPGQAAGRGGQRQCIFQ